MPLHKTPLCSFKYVGQSISSSAAFKYDTSFKLSKSDEVKIIDHVREHEIFKDEFKALYDDILGINLDKSKELYRVIGEIQKDRSKVLYRNYMMVIKEKSKSFYDNSVLLNKVSSKSLCGEIDNINIKDFKEMHVNDVCSVSKADTKDLNSFIDWITKEDLRLMKLNNIIDVVLNDTKEFENLDDDRNISIVSDIELETTRACQISIEHKHNLDRDCESQMVKDLDKSVIVKSIAPYMVKSNEKILNPSAFSEMGISTSIEITLIVEHEISKSKDILIVRGNESLMNKANPNKDVIISKEVSISKSDQMSLYKANTTMMYDNIKHHYFYDLSMFNIDIIKNKILKINESMNITKLNDPKGLFDDVIIDINVYKTNKMMYDATIRGMIKTQSICLNPIHTENIMKCYSPSMLERIKTGLTLSDSKSFDLIGRYNIDKHDTIELRYDHDKLIKVESNISLTRTKYDKISLSDDKYLGAESAILIDYSDFKNVNAIHPSSNMSKSDDKELTPIRDIRPIMLNDTFNLRHKMDHEINKESILEIAASHYYELNKLDIKNLSHGTPKGIIKNDEKFLNKSGKLIDKTGNNRFINGSNILIDKYTPVMVKPYGSIEVFKNKYRLMYKTYKPLGKIISLKALNKGYKIIYHDDHNEGLNKLSIPIFNNYDAKWLNKDRLNIFTDKQRFVEETPWNITLIQGSFLNKDRIDMFRQDQKPMYRERMPIIYEVPPHLLEVTKRWWVLGVHGPYDQKILPYDYGYSKSPLWVNRREREFGGHFMQLKNHPISYMPYLENNKGKDLNYGTNEIALSIEIMLDMVNMLVMIFKHSSSQFANCSGQEAIEFIMELFFDWLNLDSTKTQMSHKGSREHYLRCYRWFRWESEKVWFMADKNHTQDRMHGIKFTGILVKNVLEYMKNHHFNVVPLWRNVTFMDIERQFNRNATNGDLMVDLDKLKGKRHYFIESKKS